MLRVPLLAPSLHLTNLRLANHNFWMDFMRQTAESILTFGLITMLMGTYALLRGSENKEESIKES